MNTMDIDDFFDDIAMMALEPDPELARPMPIEDRVALYDKAGMVRTVKLWKKFAVHLPSPSNEVEKTTPFQSPPSIRWLQMFMLWRAKTAVGKLDHMVAVSTLLKELEQIRRAVFLGLGHQYDNKDVILIKRVSEIKSDVPKAF
jgi:hypothetical protein